MMLSICELKVIFILENSTILQSVTEEATGLKSLGQEALVRA